MSDEEVKVRTEELAVRSRADRVVCGDIVRYASVRWFNERSKQDANDEGRIIDLAKDRARDDSIRHGIAMTTLLSEDGEERVLAVWVDGKPMEHHSV